MKLIVKGALALALALVPGPQLPACCGLGQVWMKKKAWMGV